jgi:signal transduction histidine kinase
LKIIERRHATASGILYSRLLNRGRAIGVGVALLAVTLFVASMPAWYEAFPTHSILNNPNSRDVALANLAQLGLSIGFYIGFYMTLGIIFATVSCALAGAIFWRRSDYPMALFVALVLVLFGTTYPGAIRTLEPLHPVLAWLSVFLESLSVWSMFLFFYLFPEGRFVPRWTRWLAVTWTAWTILSFFHVAPFDPANWPLLLYPLFLLGWLLSGVFAQIYRYLRVSGSVERQQTKWIIFGFAVGLLGMLIVTSLDEILGVGAPEPGSLADFAASVALYCFILLIPVSISIAILRYRLWDIDALINRTLVYGALTATVVGLYVLVVGGLGALLQTRGNIAASLGATGVVAVLFAPLRNRLQRGVNRLMYGERDEPYSVLSRLGRRLEGTLAPEAALETVAEAVTQALKLPYATIELKQDGEFRRVAQHGTSKGETITLPLLHQGEEVGRLMVAPRSPGGTFSSQDSRLLEDLARQAGAAAHASRLTADLRRSKERLITAREEERRRLRRDLHDGLGPTLGGLTLGLDAARSTLPHGASTTEALLTELKTQSQEAVSDIRRLVHGLRPPALDDLGLVPAIRQQATKHGNLLSDFSAGIMEGSDLKNGLTFSVKVPENLPPLPAAVEVACYRIAQEAITNVSRHAKASCCRISLVVDEARDALVLEVADDGVGVPEGRRAGVGTSSMRERAEELGGTLTIEPIREGGTRVLARLALPAEDPKEKE